VFLVGQQQIGHNAKNYTQILIEANENDFHFLVTKSNERLQNYFTEQLR